MTPARERAKLEHRTFPETSNDAKLEPGVLRSSLGRRSHANQVARLVLPEPVVPLPRRLGDSPFDDRPVDLLDRPRPELFRKSCGRLTCSGEEDHARRRLIEP